MKTTRILVFFPFCTILKLVHHYESFCSISPYVKAKFDAEMLLFLSFFLGTPKVQMEQNTYTVVLNPLAPNDPYSGRTAPLTSKRCILYIYSTNTGTEYFNLLTPNDDYSGHTAPLTSKCCILYIYSTNTCTEYFKHGIYSLGFPLQNAVCFINLNIFSSFIIHFLYTGCAKIKKIIPAPKG